MDSQVRKKNLYLTVFLERELRKCGLQETGDFVGLHGV